MNEDEISKKLSVIINLLAIQATNGLEKEKSVSMLKYSGMGNKEIGDVMGISGSAVAAHLSNLKKKSKKRK
ncbi:MAG: LuxR C-terminal-related transcriptional regulator [candidate division Zixibacteria bacterium]